MRMKMMENTIERAEVNEVDELGSSLRETLGRVVQPVSWFSLVRWVEVHSVHFPFSRAARRGEMTVINMKSQIREEFEKVDQGILAPVEDVSMG
jgi:hypothetical protein